MSGAPSGTAQRDLQNGINYWMKSFALERRFSGYSFFAAEKRVTGSKGFESKTGMDASKRSACTFGNN
ncbi:hypothetical protein [Paraglaciecola arctica]|nr:hypothetical protein [Paraglaciecola arctica]